MSDKGPTTGDGQPIAMGENLFTHLQRRPDPQSDEWTTVIVECGFIEMWEGNSPGTWAGTVRDGDGNEWLADDFGCYSTQAAAEAVADNIESMGKDD